MSVTEAPEYLPPTPSAPATSRGGTPRPRRLRASTPRRGTARPRWLGARTTPRRGSARRRWLGGGTAGNEQLTAMVGTTLLVLLALMGVTILRIHQLLTVHMFVGVLLAGPIGLKLASTGYRFVRYYTGDPAYRRVGPPSTGLRVLAPALIAATLALFGTGLLLLLEGAQRDPRVMFLHKASFFLWFGVTALHVLGHLPGLPRALRAVRSATASGLGDPGRAGRLAALAGAVLVGLVLALALRSHFVSVAALHGFPH